MFTVILDIVLVHTASISYSLKMSYNVYTYIRLKFVYVVDDTDEINQCLKMILDAFLQNLPKCVNRELIDKVHF